MTACVEIETENHSMTMPTRHYKLHQAALLPVMEGARWNEWQTPDEVGVDGFAEFLVAQKMHGYWAEAIKSDSSSAKLTELESRLETSCRQSAALELPQQRSMLEVHELLTAKSIPYFFAKGAHLRHLIYTQLWHRPASDVDVFIHKRDHQRAISAFEACGFSIYPDPATLSHEINIEKYGSYVDLHWHLMRPSRYHPELDNWLFLHREKFGDYWGLDHTASLLVMLTHPAITKYLISPTSLLIHQVDQLKLMASGQVNWDELSRALHSFGLKTAAWSSVYLLELLTGRKTYSHFEKGISPGRLKRRYIQAWIERAWISRLFNHRWLVAGGFSLCLQDSLRDTVRALLMTWQARMKEGPAISVIN